MSSFLGYYTRLAMRAPVVAAKAANNTLLLLGVILVGLALFNRQLAREVSSWNGFSPIWALVPFAVLFFYGLLKANHDNLLSIVKERDEARSESDCFRNTVLISPQPVKDFRSDIERGVAQMNEQQEKREDREKEIIRRLYREYILTHDLAGDPRYISGLGSLPTWWVDKRLNEMGETWRRKHYTPV